MPIEIQTTIEWLLTIVLGAAIATPLLVLNSRWAHRLGLIDWPKARGVAQEQVPIIGHSLVLISLGFLSFSVQFFHLSPWFVTTAVIMAAMGHFDDQKPLAALDKIFFQFLCVGCVVLLDPHLNEAVYKNFGAEGNIWAILFIVGLINAVNFIDGIDGLAAITLVVAGLGLSFLHPFAKNSASILEYQFFGLFLAGMLIPFLYINVMKRKGFLGNVGSYFFSYVLGVMHLSLGIEATHPIHRMALTGLIFLIPICDGINVVFKRLFSGRSPFHADKGHFHHRLIQTNLPLRYVLLCFGIIELAGLACAFGLRQSEMDASTALPTILAFSFLAVVSMFFLVIDHTSKNRVQAVFNHLDKGDTVFFLKYFVHNKNGSPVAPHVLRRLEARINAEIRISDTCFLQYPDTLFVLLRTVSEPLRNISSRIEEIFEAEKLTAHLSTEYGEFVKVVHQLKPLKKVS